MANAEQSRNMGEKMGDFLKRFGLVGAMIGAIGILANIQIGAVLFKVGLGTAAVGYAGEKLSGSGKKK